MSVIDANWNYCRGENSIEKNYMEFETNIIVLRNNVDNCLKTQTFLFNLIETENQDDELKNLVDINKDLRHQKEKKLEETSIRVVQYEILKKDQKILKQEIKKTHEAFLMAKKYYKKFLKMYYTVESRHGEAQLVFVQFFTEAKKDSNNFSICLQRNTNTGHFQIVSTTPKLAITQEIQKKLQESNDMPGALCYIRHAFMEINTKKNQE